MNSAPNQISVCIRVKKRMSLLILLFVAMISAFTYYGLGSLQSTKQVTALDKSTSTGRVTGRVNYCGFGYPFVYVEFASFSEFSSGQPDPGDIAEVRKAGKKIIESHSKSGWRLHFGFLLLDLGIYMVMSLALASISLTLLHSMDLPSWVNTDQFCNKE